MMAIGQHDIKHIDTIASHHVGYLLNGAVYYHVVPL